MTLDPKFIAMCDELRKIAPHNHQAPEWMIGCPGCEVRFRIIYKATEKKFEEFAKEGNVIEPWDFTGYEALLRELK